MKSVFDDDITPRLDRAVGSMPPAPMLKPRHDRDLFCEMLRVLKVYVSDTWGHLTDEELAKELLLGNEMVRNDIAARKVIAAVEGKDAHRARGGYTGGV